MSWLIVTKQEVQRHNAGLRRNRRSVCGGHDGKIDIARPDELQDLRLLPELRAGILINQHGALAQFLELCGENVIGDAVAGIELLVVCEAIMLDLLRARCGRPHQRRGRKQCSEDPCSIIH
jgi:hypothetical protein